MIISLYQADPQFRTAQVAGELLGDTALTARNLDASPGLVIEGHPLFEYGVRGGGDDAYFPKIGVQWQSDEEEKPDLNFNTRRVKVSGAVRAKLEYYLTRDRVRMFPLHQDSDFEYEQLSAPFLAEMLDHSGYCWYSARHVTSMVVVSGWATGNAGPKGAKFLYEAMDGILPFLFQELRGRYRVGLKIVGSPALNLVSDQFGPAYGFELMLGLTQLKQSFRLIPNSEYLPPRQVFIHAELGGTSIETLFNSSPA